MRSGTSLPPLPLSPTSRLASLVHGSRLKLASLLPPAPAVPLPLVSPAAWDNAPTSFHSTRQWREGRASGEQSCRQIRSSGSPIMQTRVIGAVRTQTTTGRTAKTGGRDSLVQLKLARISEASLRSLIVWFFQQTGLHSPPPLRECWGLATKALVWEQWMPPHSQSILPPPKDAATLGF